MRDSEEEKRRAKVISRLNHAACRFGASGSSLCKVTKRVGVSAAAEPPRHQPKTNMQRMQWRTDPAEFPPRHLKQLGWVPRAGVASQSCLSLYIPHIIQ